MTIADTLRRLCSIVAADPTSDGELVGRFVRTQDEPAFAELLRRHGPAVYGVCRRVLGNSPDVDDAFQAVFLVLARKARVLRQPQTVGNWLYGVALRTANKARVMNARKASRRCEPPGGLDQQPAVQTAGSPDRDTLAVIDAELAALPERYRAAFVACDLNGQSRSEAARGLGWPEGTVAARLQKARELLAARLSKRGVTLGVGVLTVAAEPTATSASTLAAVRELLAAGTAAAVAPAAQELADEVVKAMPPASAKWLAVVGVLLALTVGGAVLLARTNDKTPPKDEVAPEQAQAVWKEGKALQFAGGGRITSVAFSPDGKYIAVATGDEVRLLDAKTRQQVNEMPIKADSPATFTAVAFSPDGNPDKGYDLAATHKHGVFVIQGGRIVRGGSSTGTVEEIVINEWQGVGGGGGDEEIRNFDPHQLSWKCGKRAIPTNAAFYDYGRTAAGFPNYRLPPDPENNEHDALRRLNWARGDIGQSVITIQFNCKYSGDRWSFDILASGYTSVDCNQIQITSSTSRSDIKGRLNGHTSCPVGIGVTADSTRIVSVDDGGTLIVWEGKGYAFTEKSRVTLGTAAGQQVVQFALAPDGKTVAVLRRTDGVHATDQLPVRFELFSFDVTFPPAKPTPLATYRLPAKVMPNVVPRFARLQPRREDADGCVRRP